MTPSACFFRQAPSRNIEHCNEMLDDTSQKAQSAVAGSEIEEIARYLDALVRLDGCYGPTEFRGDHYRRALLTGRKLLADWYVKNPIEHAAQLAGNVGPYVILEHKKETQFRISPLMNAVAERFLWTEDQLALLAKSSDVFDADRGASEYPYALMRVDALKIKYSQLLTSDEDDAELQRTITAEKWIAAWEEERVLWEKARTERSTLSFGDIELAQRLTILGEHAFEVCRLFPAGDFEGYRSAIGMPLKRALGTAAEAAPSMKIKWVVPIRYEVSTLTSTVPKEEPVDSVLADLSEFDDVNACGLFSLRDAQEHWLRMIAPGEATLLLSPERSDEAFWKKRAFEEDMLGVPALRLFEAVERIESPRARLEGVAHLVRMAGLGDTDIWGKASEANMVDGWRGASLHFAEVVLCLMNNALLEGPGRDCKYPTEAGAELICERATIKVDHAPARGGLMPPDVVQKSYSKLMRVIQANTSRGSQLTLFDNTRRTWVPRPVTPALACELDRIATHRTLSALALDMEAQTSLLHVLNRTELRAPVEDLPMIIASILTLIDGHRARYCKFFAPQQCQANAIALRLERTAGSTSPREKDYRSFAESYCDFAATSHQFLDLISSGTPSLVDKSREFESGLSVERRVRAYRGDLKLEKEDCKKVRALLETEASIAGVDRAED